MGAWFDPFPSDDDLGYWGLLDNTMRVSKWPQPGSNRTDCGFRFPDTLGLFPLPSRIYSELRFYLVNPPPFDPTEVEALWWDLSVVGPSKVEFTTPPSPLSGRVYTLTIEYFLALPITGFPGELMTQRIEEGAEWFESVKEYPAGAPNRALFYKWNQFAADPIPLSTTDSESAGWPYVFTDPLGMGVADCFSFPPLVIPPVEGFAAFNGIDAYIKFLVDMPYSTAQFKCEFDFRPHQALAENIVNGLARFPSFGLRMHDLDRCEWWNRSISLSPGLTLGVWQKVRIEHNWSVPGAIYTVWIDDVLQGSLASSHTISPWDQMGKRGPVFGGEFDLRNFLEWGGTPGLPVLRIDVPLIDDACPVIPLTNKGTTFNMDLVSCP